MMQPLHPDRTRNRELSRARSRALTELAREHPDEFEALLRVECARVGIERIQERSR